MAPRDRVGEDRIWFKATHGLEGVTEIGRDPGLCASAVPTDDATVIPDTLLDPVACSNPLVAGPMGVRFYAATPIITADGYRLGTVNVLDTRPREISEADSATLADLAAAVRDQLEPRLSALHVVRVEQERRKVEQDKRQAEEEARRRAERDRAGIAAFASPLQRTLVPRHCPRCRGWSRPATTRPPPRRRWAATSTTSSPSAAAGGLSSWAMCAARARKQPRSPH
ncbi:GAF domain-containing protein [Streptomyces globisporus]|uniref:GAF domain-containing protein n=1 Tax=Streptomyces globisporus TaxID=1908 RepID=UPI003805D3C9